MVGMSRCKPGKPKLTSDQLQATVACVDRHRGDRYKAAAELGVHYGTVCAHLRAAGVRGQRGSKKKFQSPAMTPQPYVPRSVAHTPEAELWKKYWAERSEAVRNQLMEKYLPLANMMAGKLAQRVPGNIDFDTLHSAAHVGLMQAVEGYEPGYKTKFSSYAQPRIRGAMLDEIRNNDHVPRLTRLRMKSIEAARHQIAQDLCRPPTDDQVAAELGLTSRSEMAPLAMVSIDQKAERMTHPDSYRQGTTDNLLPAAGDKPSSKLAREQMFRDITRGLNLCEQTLLWQYFIHGSTMKQVGLGMGLSESRVSQMISSALTRLKAKHDRAEAWETFRATVA
jgi:RNA polymerase sigma factor for flagellar operon FliA